ncbi:hypothetical protein CAOG_009402 [Capsaspora owczarzaki ATCC 30864]|uniref:Uncharacterized protein n=1 Tax=Capsaspora owczarzaki (strain ATCC 30864) TaxID=595528 RepID=A0A0D2WIW2_CAPO3|nr:hypothetical protein CAOG_009402 [Capsaspora owczarzaki ATCC 30864]
MYPLRPLTVFAKHPTTPSLRETAGSVAERRTKSAGRSTLDGAASVAAASGLDDGVDGGDDGADCVECVALMYLLAGESTEAAECNVDVVDADVDVVDEDVVDGAADADGGGDGWDFPQSKHSDPTVPCR